MSASGPLQPGKNDEGLVGSVVGVLPTITDVGIEEIGEQIVWVKRTQVLRFQHASALKFGKAFQFIPGEAT